MRIEVDCSKVRGHFPHFWESTGFTPASLLLQSPMQFQLDMIGAIAHHGIRYVRIHYLLDLVKVNKDRWGNILGYDWDYLDKGLRQLVKNGLLPIFELMGNPSGHFGDFRNDDTLQEWRDFIAALAAHLIESFGRDEVKRWYFETWNEPDIRGGWFRGSDETFCAYYDACADGLWSVEPSLKFGGPGTCITLSSTFQAFVKHCVGGANRFNPKAPVRVDFLSVHEKGAPQTLDNISPSARKIIQREKDALEYIAAVSGGMLDIVPFWNDECDPQVGWQDKHPWRGQPYYAAFSARVIDQHYCAFIRQKPDAYLPFGLLGNDHGFLGSWEQRSLLAFLAHDVDLPAGQAGYQDDDRRFELMERQVPCEFVKKPIYNLFTMLSLLGDINLAVHRSSGREQVGVLATMRNEEQVAILLYASADDITVAGKVAMHLTVKNLPFEPDARVLYQIDQYHTNPYPHWLRGIQSNGEHAGFSEETIHLMDLHQELCCTGTEAGSVDDGDGNFRLSFPLLLPGVALVVLSKKPDNAPARLKGLWSACYPALDGGVNRLLRWQTCDDYNVKTFEVEGSTRYDGGYRRLSNFQFLDNAYLHRSVTDQPYFYRVRVIDYWDRPSPWSEVHAACLP